MHTKRDAIEELGRSAERPDLRWFVRLCAVQLCTFGLALDELQSQELHIPHEVEGKNHTILLSHRMGKKWSIFFEENLKTIFGRLGIDLETETSTNLVRRRFVVKSQGSSQ